MKAPDKGKHSGQKTGVKKSIPPPDTRDTRDTRRNAKPAEDYGKKALELLSKPFSFTGWGFQTPTLDTAEKEAQLAEIEGNGELAEWWRGLADANTESKRSYDEWERIARLNMSALLARAEKDEGALLPLFLTLSQLLSGLHALAAHGDKKAALFLMNAVGEAVGGFELLAHAKPELFREWARSSFAIPGMISRNAEKCADNGRLLNALEQGEDFHLAILPTGKRGKKWKFQDRANSLAVRLQSHIEHARTVYELDSSRAQYTGRELPSWREVAMRLEPFSPKTWKAWAKVAWQVLVEISPEGKPEKNRAFYEPATAICNVRKTRTEDDFHKYAECDSRVTRACPSIALEDIREAFSGAFELIATGATRRTARRRKPQPKKPDNYVKDR